MTARQLVADSRCFEKGVRATRYGVLTETGPPGQKEDDMIPDQRLGAQLRGCSSSTVLRCGVVVVAVLVQAWTV